jgi:hypothetical protein
MKLAFIAVVIARFSRQRKGLQGIIGWRSR